MFEINLCCPDCGCYEWHTMQNLEPGEWCCANCGTVCTVDEMTAIAFEHYK
jgi:transcription initiation factor TFIIIB Brf1 subunit/transcription initiation factor TFIIB